MKLKPLGILRFSVNVWELLYKLLKFPNVVYLILRYIFYPQMFDKETRYNKYFRYGFMHIGSGLATPAELKTNRHLLRAILDSTGAAYRATLENKPVVLVDWPAPAEIVRAFGIDSMPPAIFMVIANNKTTDCASYHLETVENEGIASDLCSMNRIYLGAYYLDQLPSSPVALITTAHPCDSNVVANQILSYKMDIPAFNMDTVYGKSEEALDNYEQNAWKLIEFLEKILKKKIDWDKLKYFAENLNQTNHYLNELTLMHRAIPAPGLIFPLVRAWTIKLIHPGSPALTMHAKSLYDLARKRLRKHSKRLAKHEKIRVITWDMAVVHAELYIWMKDEFGAVVVTDYVGSTDSPMIDTSTKKSIVRGIARDKLYLGMVRQAHGTVVQVTEGLEKIIDEYEADCIIFNGHIGCKHNLAVQKIVKDTAKKSGLPVLYMAVDIFDKRPVPEKEIKRQIREFFISNGLA